MNKDNAHAATLKLQHFLKIEFLIWFANTWLALGLCLYTAFQYNTVQSIDVNRSYIPTTLDSEYLIEIPNNKPSPATSLDVEEWLTDALEFCLTFDFQSYGHVSSECNSRKFSTVTISNSTETKGQHFQRQLQEAGLLDILIQNKTSMTIEIMNVEFITEGVRTYNEKRLKEDGFVSIVDNRYVYEFEVTFKVKMVGQKLDVPIRYQVLVERTSMYLRTNGLAIRSVLSLQ
ncbi:hypothetical protein L1D14_25555 [Vibrio tubiashii]|uniref:hypothetical protein n=1 Tax=Vibrio tubiashii TaxID=29498 RepID=UPI001EFDA4B4|nr:hypothetical protein [Vibrio tubiashii]MCG9579578.1 hypothetical protein [Vibrio tubiashii]